MYQYRKKYSITYYLKNRERILKRAKERRKKIYDDPEAHRQFLEKRKLWLKKYYAIPENKLCKIEADRKYKAKLKEKKGTNKKIESPLQLKK